MPEVSTWRTVCENKAVRKGLPAGSTATETGSPMAAEVAGPPSPLTPKEPAGDGGDDARGVDLPDAEVARVGKVEVAHGVQRDAKPGSADTIRELAA